MGSLQKPLPLLHRRTVFRATHRKPMSKLTLILLESTQMPSPERMQTLIRQKLLKMARENLDRVHAPLSHSDPIQNLIHGLNRVHHIILGQSPGLARNQCRSHVLVQSLALVHIRDLAPAPEGNHRHDRDLVQDSHPNHDIREVALEVLITDPTGSGGVEAEVEAIAHREDGEATYLEDHIEVVLVIKIDAVGAVLSVHRVAVA